MQSSNMNNSSDSTNAFPFNFSNMDNTSYCQSTQGQGNMADHLNATNGNPCMQQQHQSQFGGGNAGHHGNMNLVQSLFQGSSQGGHQQSQGQASDVASGSNASSASSSHNWQSCRFCQQKFYVTSERLLEHEISCPMHLQVQQFLQQQHTSDALSAQLQMQQNQLQQQFNKAQAQTSTMMGGSSQGLNQGMDSLCMPANNMNMFGNNNMNMFGNMGGFQSNDLQVQDQFSLLQQAQLQGNSDQQFQGSAAASASAAGMPPLPGHQSSTVSNEDQFQTAINRLPAFAEPKPLESSSPNSTTDYFPLAMAEDEEWITPLHCFVRKYCVEVFVATAEDVAAPCMGKRNPVSVNQVGIRCPYCSPERMSANENIDVTRARENGVVYPSLISRIYNSSINLLQRHLRSCAFVPPEILARYEELKSSNARSGASKKYWADSAQRLGLKDTPDGIRLDKDVHKAHIAAVANGGKKTPSLVAREAPPLVLPSDKRNTTAFTFHLMSQMQPCVFTEADRLGRRRGLDVGFAGLACRHCFGVYGSGRFFPSSVKTMADASKTLDVIYRHVMKCKNCPCDIKGGLRNLRDFHDSERSKMPFGNQRAFFVKIWGRLHENAAEVSAAGGPLALPAPAPVLAPAPATMADQTSSMPPLGEPLKTGEGKLENAPESLQGLYAMVKRESAGEVNSDTAQNKLTTEAA